MIFDLTAKLLFGYEAKTSNEKNLSERFTYFLQGLMSFPLNVPGTTFHQCLEVRTYFHLLTYHHEYV